MSLFSADERRLFNPWVGKQPTPVFLPGESHAQRRWRAAVHGVAVDTTEATLPAARTPAPSLPLGCWLPCAFHGSQDGRAEGWSFIFLCC